MGNRAFLAAVFFTLGSSTAVERHCLGPCDLDADHSVNLGDMFLLVECLGGPDLASGNACPPEMVNSADPDRDGDSDLLDFAEFARRFGQIYVDYGLRRADKEAEFHAILLTGELRAPDQEYERISRDLVLIRREYPDLTEVFDEGSAPNRGLVVRLFSDAEQSDFVALNEHFVYTSIQDFGIETYYVQYCDVLLTYALALTYQQSSEIRDASEPIPACMPPCCRNRIVVNAVDELFRYEFYFFRTTPDGLASCGCMRKRVLEVNNEGTVNQLTCEDDCLPECP